MSATVVAPDNGDEVSSGFAVSVYYNIPGAPVDVTAAVGGGTPPSYVSGPVNGINTWTTGGFVHDPGSATATATEHGMAGTNSTTFTVIGAVLNIGINPVVPPPPPAPMAYGGVIHKTITGPYNPTAAPDVFVYLIVAEIKPPAAPKPVYFVLPSLYPSLPAPYWSASVPVPVGGTFVLKAYLVDNTSGKVLAQTTYPL